MNNLRRRLPRDAHHGGWGLIGFRFYIGGWEKGHCVRGSLFFAARKKKCVKYKKMDDKSQMGSNFKFYETFYFTLFSTLHFRYLLCIFNQLKFISSHF